MRMMTMLAAVIAVSIMMPAPESRAQSAPDPNLDRKAVGEIVREYLLENPEVLEEAMQILRQRREEERLSRARAAIAENDRALRAHPLSPVSGNPEGDVTVVEFFDYRCSYCKRAFPAVMALLESDDRVRVVWKEFPILGPVSDLAAVAAMAADRQGLYHDFHVAMMGTGEKLTEEGIFGLAAAVGLDVERLRRDMGDPAIAAYLEETRRLAGALGISGTPAFVIGDSLVPGAIDDIQMKELVAAARADGNRRDR